jgi:glycosyltransferase involved in cell wall biosynthesis
MAEDTLFLAFYFYPANTSGVQRAGRLYKYLPEYGHRLHVVASSAAGVRPDLKNVAYVSPADPADTGLRCQTWLANAIRRVVPYNEQLPWVPHAVRAASRLVEQHGITSMLSTSPPVGSHFAAYWLKQRFPQLRWVADFRDPLLGSPGRTRKWATPYDRAIQRAFFHRADSLVTVTEPIAQSWRDHYPGLAAKIHVICNGFDPAEGFGPKPLPQTGYQVLAHVGVIYPPRHPVPVVQSLERLTESGRLDPRSVRLRLVGVLEEAERFLALPAVRSLQAKGCIEIQSHTIPRADAMNEVATSHALLLLDFAGEGNLGYAVPAKLYEYILTGRPILAVTPRNSPVDLILKRSGVPYFVLYEDDSPETIDEKVLGIFRAPPEPATPSAWFRETFDGRRQAGTFAGLLSARAGAIDGI